MKIKKNILLILAIINTFIFGYYFFDNLINDFSVFNIVVDLFLLFLSSFSWLFLIFNKKIKHFYFISVLFAFFAFLGLSISTYILNILGLIITFIELKEEKGMLVKVIKNHPVFMSGVIVLSCVSFLAFGSLIEFFSGLIYGNNMLGELIATIFLFFMIFMCRKNYLIYKNKGSIKEAIVVSLPFIIYCLYIGCGLFAINLIEGYEFLSFDNIIVIILLYFLVGIFEDFLTRGLTLNILLDKFGKTKRGIWVSIFLSSLIFGLIHLTNLFTGASLEGVLVQVVAATCIGMYFSAIYLRSGNVWVVALLHGFYDTMVSVGSFFHVSDVVDVTGEYADTISNYSWGSLIVGAIFIGLTVFLLRKNKMNDVFALVNEEEIVDTKNGDDLRYVLIGVGLGLGCFFCISTVTSLFQLKNYASSFYEMIPNSVDYQKEYGLLFKNGYSNYDSISDEVKMLVVFSNIDKIQKVEEKEISNEVVTYVEDYEIEEIVKKLFNKKDKINYVDFKYSYKTYCDYEEDMLRYKCITNNRDNNLSNNLNVYSNIEKIILSGDSIVELYVYYLVEDLTTNTIYADSDLKTVYRYNATIDEMTDGVIYDKKSDNKEFWNNIKTNNNGKVPSYKISLNLNTLGDGVYFVSSELVRESIENNYFYEKALGNNMYRYSSDEYVFDYDKKLFSIQKINNYLCIKNENEVVLRIETINSDEWLEMYKNINSISVNLGKNTYQNLGDDYLIYKNNFYLINVDINNIEVHNKLMEVISSLEFK